MSVDFRHRIEIARPAAEVFAFVAEFRNNPRWQGGMVSCEWTSQPPVGVGSTYVQSARFMGRSIETHFEVTELEPGRRISIQSTVSTFPIQVTRSVEPTGDASCIVEAHVRGQPTGLLKLFSGMVARSVARDYAALRRLLEDDR